MVTLNEQISRLQQQMQRDPAPDEHASGIPSDRTRFAQTACLVKEILALETMLKQDDQKLIETALADVLRVTLLTAAAYDCSELKIVDETLDPAFAKLISAVANDFPAFVDIRRALVDALKACLLIALAHEIAFADIFRALAPAETLT